jgi:crotonobetainyl-CoA:carnitine CoA-transferase CaiB-like acyl-CoA transferase
MGILLFYKCPELDRYGEYTLFLIFSPRSGFVQRSGEGEYMDVAMFDVAIQLLEAKFVDFTVTGNIPQRTGNRYPYVSPFDTFLASDGYVFIICAGDHPFKSLCDAMGKPELAQDERFSNFFVRNQNEPDLKSIIEEWTRKQPAKSIVECLRANGVPAATVNNVKQVVEHPHTIARGMLVDIDQPGAGLITIFGPALKALNSLVQARGPAPALGEHNRWALEQVLKKSPDEVERILKSGAMG